MAGTGEMMVGCDIDDLPKNDANFTALTPLWFLERAAQVHPNGTSLVYGSQRYTWHHTYQRCRRFASALSNHSIGLGHTKYCMLNKPGKPLFNLHEAQG
ncbi:unnamed protein product [Lupinus luteus]|uniref:Uncharacterized protein n=1 Tax=Lupinus luteus TaxID=3873 RepID=A0AAV1WJL3_LUPLU